MSNIFQADTKVIFPEQNEERSNADESVVHNISNHEIKIGDTHHSGQKEGIDNFTIMQRSGSELLSPLRASSALAKHTSASRGDMIFPRGDFLSSSSVRQKKIYTKRLSMKSTTNFEDENIKSVNIERIVTENVKTEMTISTPRLRTQGETELENLLSTLNQSPFITKNSEEK